MVGYEERGCVGRGCLEHLCEEIKKMRLSRYARLLRIRTHSAVARPRPII
jgi:hypothetical protein